MQLKMIGVKKMKKTMMTGKNNLSLNDLFIQQLVNQDKMLHDGMYDEYKSEHTSTVPVDDVKLSSYHVQHLISEVGEILDADKRWKNFRNEKYDKDAKVEEIADCFIVLMNIAMYSGMDGRELTEAIKSKLDKVSERFNIN